MGVGPIWCELSVLAVRITWCVGQGGIAGQTTKTVPATGAELGKSGWIGDNKAGKIWKRCHGMLSRAFKTLTGCVGLACFSQLHPPGSFLLAKWQRRSCPGLNVGLTKERSRIIPCNFLKITWAIDSARNLFFTNFRTQKFTYQHKTWHLTRSSGRLLISNSAPLNSSACIETCGPPKRIFLPGPQSKLLHY